MTRSLGRRTGALAAFLLTGMVVTLTVAPASAQTTPRLRFTADCVNTGATANAVDVPAGTTVPGLGVVTTTTTVTTPNTPVIFPNGTTAILNQVVQGPNSVTRNAIVITSGPDAGTVIGRVVCNADGSQATPLVGSGIVANCPPGSQGAVAGGTATIGSVTVGSPAGARCTPRAAAADGLYTIGPAAYPLALDVTPPAEGAPDAAMPSVSSAEADDVGLPTSAVLVAGGLVVAVLAQVVIGRGARRRRADATN